MIIRIKEQPMWEELFAKHSSDKGLISKNISVLVKLYRKMTSNFIKKCAEKMNKRFPKGEIQMNKRHMKKKFSESLFIREMRIETAMKYHLNIKREYKHTSKGPRTTSIGMMLGEWDSHSVLVGMLTETTFWENNNIFLKNLS